MEVDDLRDAQSLSHPEKNHLQVYWSRSHEFHSPESQEAEEEGEDEDDVEGPPSDRSGEEAIQQRQVGSAANHQTLKEQC
jgi:hypothetical protein